MEISKATSKYKNVLKRKNPSNSISDAHNLRDSFLPLPWTMWPYEGKLLIILIGIWSILGLFILGSASWWVASKEMGDWAYYLKRQIIWCIPGLTFFYYVLNTDIRVLLKISKFIFLPNFFNNINYFFW